MSTTSLIYQFVQHSLSQPKWLERASRRRTLRQAIAHVYPAFARRYPEWVNYLFDEQFLQQRAFPLLTQYLAYKVVPTPFELAQIWAEQFTWSNLEMKERHIARLMPIATDFLRHLSKDLFS